MTDFTTPAVPDVATDPTERAAQIDRDELGLSLAEHWAKRGIVQTFPDLSPDEFDNDDTVVFRAYVTAVDFVLDRLAAAGLIAAAPLPGVDRLYAHLVSDRPPSARQREVSPGVVLDFDVDGRPIGVEVVGAVSVEIDGTPVAAPVPDDAVDRARQIIADHCFGPHASKAAEERALDIAGACTDDMADEGLLAAAAAQPDDEAAILIADLYDIASQVHSENRHDGRTTPGKAWTDAAWLVYQRASDQARAALAALRGKQQ